MQGRFEVHKKEFQAAKKKSPKGGETRLSLKDVFPDYFQKTDKTPRLIIAVARHILDGHFSEYNGVYNMDSLPQVKLFYRSLPPNAAKAKTQNLPLQMKFELKDALKQGWVNKYASSPRPASKTKKESTFFRTIRDGSKKITFKDLDLWAEQLIVDIRGTSTNAPFPPELIKIGKEKQFYTPVWDTEYNKVHGSLTKLEGLKKTKSAVEKYRRDLINLVATYINALEFFKDGLKGHFYIPVNSDLFLRPKIAELFTLVVDRFHPTVRKSMIFEVEGLTKETPPQEIVEHIQSLSATSGGVIIESDPLYPFTHDLDGIQPLAYGFKMNKLKALGMDESNLVKQFAEHYEECNIKTFAKNVKHTTSLDLLIKCHISFISGPAIAPHQRQCFEKHTLLRSDMR